MSLLSTMIIKLNSNAVVPVVGFCINQIPAFPLPTLSFTLGNTLNAIIILFYFFKIGYFRTKLPKSTFYRTNKGFGIVVAGFLVPSL